MLNINYAVSINTNTNITNTNIGMYNGVLRYVSDRYVITTDTFETSEPVDNPTYWYKDFIAKDGLSNAGLQIDITEGGDYAYLQGFDIKLINNANSTPFHLSIGSESMMNQGVFAVGSEVQLFVIIDKVWYYRWSGIVTDTVIDDVNFKFVCEDKNIKDYKLLPNNIINKDNYPNALPSDNGKVVPRLFGKPKYSKVISTTTLIKKFDDTSYTVTRLKPNMFETATDGAGRVSEIDSPSTYIADSLYGNSIPPNMQFWYQTGAASTNNYLYINTNNNYYAVVIGVPKSYNTSNLIGKFLAITNSYNETIDKLTDLHLIKDALDGTTAYMTSGNNKLVYVYIDKSPVKLIDNTCLYGNITNTSSWDDNDINNNPAIKNMSTGTESIAHAFIVDANINGLVSDLPVVFNNILPVDSWYNNATYEDSNLFLYKAVNDSVGVFKSEFVNTSGDLINCISPFLNNDTPAHVLHKADSGKYFTYNSNGWADNFSSRSMSSTSNVIFQPNAYTQEIPTGIGKKVSSQTFDLTTVDNYGLCVNLTYNTGDRFQNYDNIEINYAVEFLDQIVYPQGADHPDVNNTLDLISIGIHTEAIDFKGKSVSAPYGDIGTIPVPYSVVRFEDSDSDTGTWWFSNIAYNSNLISMQTPRKGTQFTNMQYIINPLWKGSTYVDNDRIPLWTHCGELGSQPEYFYLHGQQTNIDNSINSDIFNALTDDGLLNTWFTIEPKRQTVSNNISNWTPDWSKLKIHYLGIGGNLQYKFSDLYIRAEDNNTSNVFTTISGIVEDLNGISNVNYNNLDTSRSSWNVGRQLLSQDNSFNYIQELCKQSYVCGWTGRDGSLNFDAFREYGDVPVTITHDNSIIIRGSIKNLSRTPLNQVFNEMNIKYDWNSITSNFDGVYSIGNVDEDAFPEPYELYPENTTYVDNFTWYGTKGFFFKTGFNRVPPVGQKMSFVTTDGYEIQGTVTNTDLRIEVDITDMQTGTPTIITVNIMNIQYIIDFTNYVSGVLSYLDAKEIWETAHTAWLESKTINNAGTELTELDWFNDLNSYYESSNYDSTIESAYLYFKNCVNWLTRQKWKINYQIPVTPDTITLELMQRVNFNDAIITGNNQVATGWITQLILDTNRNIFDIELTFEYFIAIPPAADVCNNIIETGYNVTNIIETGSNADNIIEGICGR